MGTLKTISHNVKGLHSPVKRKKIMLQLKQAKCQIAFFQETHLSDVEHDMLKKSWADKVYYSSHQSGRKRGVSILIHRHVNFIETSAHKDNEGRYILVNGLIDGTEVSLINVYAPNENDPGFTRMLFNKLLQYSTGLILMGGGFNCTMSNMLDRQPSSKAALSRMSKMLKYQCMEAGLVDVWRSRFPGSRDFMFCSSRHASYSRIDYFFTSKKDQHRIQYCLLHYPIMHL